MNISFEYYRIFYVVAKTGNITKAANELMISQPAISKCIKQLEEQLGGQLFIRTKRGVVLTEEGKEFYKYIKHAIEYIGNAESRFSEMIHLETGTIRIGISSTLTKQVLLPYLEVFHKQYPNIHIQITTKISSESLSLLSQGLLDLVITNLPHNDRSDIETIKIKDVQDAFVVGEMHKDLCGREIPLSELVKFPLILQSRGAVTRGFLDKYGEANGITFNPEMDLSSFSLIVEFTKIGFGIGYTTLDYVKDELNTNKLYKLNVVPKIPKRGVGICYSKRNIPSFCTKKLIEIILNEKDSNK